MELLPRVFHPDARQAVPPQFVPAARVPFSEIEKPGGTNAAGLSVYVFAYLQACQ